MLAQTGSSLHPHPVLSGQTTTPPPIGQAPAWESETRCHQTVMPRTYPHYARIIGGHMDYYLIALGVLILLAIADLSVGVGNDAVNFLNSAIGSKAATRRTILIIASCGVLMGAMFSNGMMEVARKGIFNPETFVFADIMIIFLAVMLTDIVLLDAFNTFGMPTSTTVSIVFELLGAAVAIALIKVLSNGGAVDQIALFINAQSALAIITGIFVSVIIAFATGALVMFVARLLFSFQVSRQGSLLGAIWCGLALTAMMVFLVFKGLKGAAFASGDTIAWIKQNLLLMSAWGFAGLTALMFILRLRGIQIFRVVVLVGTFSLAMAFAGNDLVNFIGAPVAALESYWVWVSSGLPAEQLSMEALRAPVRTDSWVLMIAGGIMMLTLWTSKKSQSVTETEVNLGRQHTGTERFKPHMPARMTVSLAAGMRDFVKMITPNVVLKWIDNRYLPPPAPQHPERPAFDLVRASTSLTVASVLIAIATSLKLPLSTTYVTFMVAMGSAMADRAWGEGSAAHRVAGVFNVIGGWFLTAGIAFTAASLVAVLLYYGGFWSLTALLALAVTALVRSTRYHHQAMKKPA